MVMAIELEGRIQTMCNLSENIEDRGIEKQKRFICESLEAVENFQSFLVLPTLKPRACFEA